MKLTYSQFLDEEKIDKWVFKTVISCLVAVAILITLIIYSSLSENGIANLGIFIALVVFCILIMCIALGVKFFYVQNKDNSQNTNYKVLKSIQQFLKDYSYELPKEAIIPKLENLTNNLESGKALLKEVNLSLNEMTKLLNKSFTNESDATVLKEIKVKKTKLLLNNYEEYCNLVNIINSDIQVIRDKVTKYDIKKEEFNKIDHVEIALAQIVNYIGMKLEIKSNLTKEDESAIRDHIKGINEIINKY